MFVTLIRGSGQLANAALDEQSFETWPLLQVLCLASEAINERLKFIELAAPLFQQIRLALLQILFDFFGRLLEEVVLASLDKCFLKFLSL